MKVRVSGLIVLVVFFSHFLIAQRRTSGTTSAQATRALTIVTEPGAIVWLDEIRRGTADGSGKLLLVNVRSGGHSLRVRAIGFKESTLPIQPTMRGEVKVRLLRTNDEDTRKKSAELYQRALRLRPAFPAAHLGLARVLMDLNDTDAALAAITDARRYRPSYPEASAVEGRIYRETGQTDEAIGAFNRAIRESHGFQPEAHVGIGRVYEDRGQYELAAREYQIAVNQLSETEPIIYQLLGAAYEKSGRNKEAVLAYEDYLRLAPNGSRRRWLAYGTAFLIAVVIIPVRTVAFIYFQF